MKPVFDEDKFIRNAIRDYYHNGDDQDEFKHCRKCKHRDATAKEAPCMRCRWCYPDMSEEVKEHD